MGNLNQNIHLSKINLKIILAVLKVNIYIKFQSMRKGKVAQKQLNKKVKKNSMGQRTGKTLNLLNV